MKKFRWNKSRIPMLVAAFLVISGARFTATNAWLVAQTEAVTNQFVVEFLETRIHHDKGEVTVENFATVGQGNHVGLNTAGLNWDEAETYTVATAHALIRVRVNVSPEAEGTNNWADIVANQVSPSWVRGDGDFFYYNQIVAPGGSTDSMINIEDLAGLAPGAEITFHQEAVAAPHDWNRGATLTDIGAIQAQFAAAVADTSS